MIEGGIWFNQIVTISHLIMHRYDLIIIWTIFTFSIACVLPPSLSLVIVHSCLPCLFIDS